MPTLAVDAFISRRELSGVERYTRELLAAMRKFTPPDWKVFLYSLDEEEVGVLKDGAPGIWEHRRLRWPPRRGWSQMRLSWELWRRAPDVFFVPHAVLPWKSPGKGGGGTVVTTIHDIGALESPELYAPSDLARQRFAIKLACSRAARVFAPSEAVKNALLASSFVRIPEDRIAVTRLGVDFDRFNGRETVLDETIRGKYGVNFPYFFYAGRVDLKKNLLTLLRAYKKFLDGFGSRGEAPRLLIAGGDGFGGHAVRDEAAALELGGKAIFLGWIPDEDLPALYRGAEIFLFPSAYEGFGLPVLEAMASGVAVLASDIPALRELGGDAVFYVNPKNEDDWSRMIREIFMNWALRSEFEAKGPARAAEFSWERCAQDTWESIVSLVK